MHVLKIQKDLCGSMIFGHDFLHCSMQLHAMHVKYVRQLHNKYPSANIKILFRIC